MIQLRIEGREDEHGERKSAIKKTGCLGGPLILECEPVRSWFVRLEINRVSKQPMQITRFCVFTALTGRE
jgi:hypothetical protein